MGRSPTLGGTHHAALPRRDRALHACRYAGQEPPTFLQPRPYGRYNLTVRLSYDEGATWTAGKTIWPHPSYYSDIVVLDDMTIGLGSKTGEVQIWDTASVKRIKALTPVPVRQAGIAGK